MASSVMSSNEPLEVVVEKEVARVNDTAILWGGVTSVDAIFLQPAARYANKFGVFHHDDMVGKPYGSKVGLQYKAIA